MANLEMNIPHQLSKAETVERIKKLLGKVKEQHADKILNLQENWAGDKGNFSFSVLGFATSGSITINDAAVDILFDLPFAAIFFKDKIRQIIEEETKKILSRADN